MRTRVAISDPLIEDADKYTGQRGDALSIDTENSPLSAIQLHTVKGSFVDPDLNLDRISELIASEDEADYPGSLCPE